jgi:phage tail sheath protein FI
MILHCRNAGDRIAILDPASPDDVNAVQTQRAGLATGDGHAALYFPWIQAAPTGTTLLLPPSGFVAGIYSANEPADSPVDVIATATGVAHTVTSAEQDILNPQGINAIRDLSGIRVWGARTLAENIQWRYVATRRLGLFIEESIFNGTILAMLEPNENQLWSDLTEEMDNFLHGLWLDGWLQGTRPEDAYFSQCGYGITMTQTDLDQGRTVMRAGFASVAPAEFIVVEVVHQRPDLSPVPAAGGVVFHPPAPNPFNPATFLRFELAGDSRVELRILDLAGRLVRVLEPGRTFGAGEHRLLWDGRDDKGRALGSGVYLARMSVAGSVRSQRLTLVR